MKNGMPIPGLKYLPKQYQDDYSAVALGAAIDAAGLGVYEDTLGLRDRYSPESCPVALLEELGASIGVDNFRTDTDAQRRARISTGVRNQGFKSLWTQDAFNRIKNITGIDPILQVYRRLDEYTWVLFGDLTPPLTYSSIGDEVDYGGFDIEGAGTEISFAGNVYIDIGAGLTQEIVDRVVAELKDYVCPAYYYVTLGYMVGLVFTPYPNGFF